MSNNIVKYVDHHGGDIAVARTAWTSTQIDVKSKTPDQIQDLIVNKLWNNKTGKAHKTPFERALIDLDITCDQASHIHLLKHRMAHINGESARYMELLEDKIFLPEDWLNYGEVGKYWYKQLKATAEFTNEKYHEALKDLQKAGMPRKRAKESARFFKTMNSQITLSVTMNMSCFANFYSLRADIDAQKEIREIAEQVYEIIAAIPEFQFIIEAFELERYNRKLNSAKIELTDEILEKVPHDVLESYGIVVNLPVLK